MFDLGKILDFSRLLHRFRAVERYIHHVGKDQFENDAEHSYDLAMLAWYLVDAYKLPLNKEKVLKYALAHDIPEIYAGDSFFYSKDPQRDEKKAAKEAEARARLKDELSEFPDLHESIEGYEEREDAESRFVYALDKAQATTNIYLDSGRTWKKNGVTLDNIVAKKRPKVSVSPEVVEYFDALIERIKKDESNLFN